MSDRWNGIAAFVQAVESGSFALAAERLNRSRSAVGKSVARLEQRLGARLFHRTTRQQSLTEAGQAFYEHCVRALAELEAAETVLDVGRQEPYGRLRVSVPVLFGRRCAAPVLLQLMQQHPQLRIEMSFSDRSVDLLEEGFDLAVRVGTLPDSASLAARRLGTQNMAICAAPSYLSRYGRPATADDLAGHAAIVYGLEGARKAWRVRDSEGRIHEPRLDARLCLDDLQAIADAAVAGLGLAWLPCWLLTPYLQAGELELVMDSESVLGAEIHAIWPQARYLPAKTRVAIDVLAQQVPCRMGLQVAIKSTDRGDPAAAAPPWNCAQPAERRDSGAGI